MNKNKIVKKLDPDLDNETAKILIAFCIHEKMYFPKVKEIFMQETPEQKKIVLQDMEHTIRLSHPNNAAYDKYIEEMTKSSTN